jgi:hypothetical protein
MTNPAVITARLQALDAALDRGAKELNSAVGEYRRLGEAAEEAASAYEVAYARAYLSYDGPEHLRRQVAVLAETPEGVPLADLKLRARTAAHLVATQKEALFALREGLRRIHAQIDTQRTLAANVRAELELDKTGFRT